MFTETIYTFRVYASCRLHNYTINKNLRWNFCHFLLNNTIIIYYLIRLIRRIVVRIYIYIGAYTKIYNAYEQYNSYITFMALCNHISTSRTNVAKSRATQSLIVSTLCTQYYARRFVYIMRYVCVFNIRILTQILVDVLFFEYKMYYYIQYGHTHLFVCVQYYILLF